MTTEITQISVETLVEYLDGRGLVVADTEAVNQALAEIAVMPTDLVARVRPDA